MPKKKNTGKKSGSKSKSAAIGSTSYAGPVLKPIKAKDDLVTVVLGYVATADVQASGGNYAARFASTYNSSGGVPGTISGNFTVSVGDTPSFAEYAVLYKAFRVLGICAEASIWMTSSSSGFGCEPVFSIVQRNNDYTKPVDFQDSPEVEMHGVSTQKNVMRRELKMLGTDEAEFVECNNVLAYAISPLPNIQFALLDSPVIRRITFFVRWRVQFRTRF